MSIREIFVEGLIQQYPGDVTAVDDVSFKVNAGEVYGFLAPFGDGKCTTIKIPTTPVLPTKGSARVESDNVPITNGLEGMRDLIKQRLERQHDLEGRSYLSDPLHSHVYLRGLCPAPSDRQVHTAG